MRYDCSRHAYPGRPQLHHLYDFPRVTTRTVVKRRGQAITATLRQRPARAAPTRHRPGAPPFGEGDDKVLGQRLSREVSGPGELSGVRNLHPRTSRSPGSFWAADVQDRRGRLSRRDECHACGLELHTRASVRAHEKGRRRTGRHGTTGRGNRGPHGQQGMGSGRRIADGQPPALCRTTRRRARRRGHDASRVTSGVMADPLMADPLMADPGDFPTARHARSGYFAAGPTSSLAESSPRWR